MSKQNRLSPSKLLAQYHYVVVFLVVFAVYAAASSSLTWNGMMNIFRHSAVIGILGLGMGLICLTGEIDLSVGSMLALLSGFSVVVFNLTDSIAVTLLFAVVCGALLGLLNGFLVGVAEMPAFIVTLATMLIYRSIAQYACQNLDKELIGGGSSVYRMITDHNSYQSFYQLGNGRLLTIPVVGIILTVMTLVLVYVTTSTKYGKKLYAVGSNQKAARLAGISVSKIKLSAFVLTGMLAGLGAFLWIVMNASADPATTGNSYEMYAIAAAVLGGISMSGGRGRCLGVLFGAMSYTVIDKIIVALKMDSLINDAIKGVILLLVIFIQVAGPRMRSRLHGKKSV
ncbi:ABC transporter permease [Butyricicoccus pullicaecorum]|uniref:ABC transporter permease n=2 Tax=Butyricicoccus pullicaecorum TaxID=501571 RepID=R8W5E3_9FIRM|nr:ABC transporter permease [Butyricicoccus pullicaecorum]EOQ40083.1 hypothetical protein HMPREF1526_00781 [Butyricicoccus pullicaecorum 1.2]OUP58722.1 ABC transporter permease [Butyricicoccus pullicaecorum]SKA65302.1 monosaccharide ABC transporter membrane protein, CUT2 family (TC 3.A.1.2.-) [Butyricicoccus pullicaecorum DSM 23266]